MGLASASSSAFFLARSSSRDNGWALGFLSPCSSSSSFLESLSFRDLKSFPRPGDKLDRFRSLSLLCPSLSRSRSFLFRSRSLSRSRSLCRRSLSVDLDRERERERLPARRRSLERCPLFYIFPKDSNVTRMWPFTQEGDMKHDKSGKSSGFYGKYREFFQPLASGVCLFALLI